MFSRFRLHIVTAVLGSLVYFWLMADNWQSAVMFGVLYLLFSITFDWILEKIKKKPVQPAAATEEDVTDLLNALGGVNNIESVDSESNRLKIEVNDYDAINQDALKDVAKDGASLTGHQIQITVGENASVMKEAINELKR